MINLCLFVADITFKGGIERVLSNLTQVLSVDTNFNITIVSQYRTYPIPNYPIPENVKIDYLSDIKFAGTPKSFGRMVSHVKNIGRIRRYFEKHNFDIISSQSFTNTFLLYCAGVDLSKVIAVEHVYWGYYGSIIQFVRRKIYSKCYAVAVLTKYDYDHYFTYLKNVYLIPNPIAANITKPEYSLTSKNIIAIGRLEEQKGFRGLIESFQRISSRFPDWHLNIFGEGNLRTELNELIVNHNLTSNIHLRGTTNNISAELKQSAFLVMSSRYEGFGMVLLEAMNEGVPCISFDCPAGPFDILGDSKYGILVKNQDFLELTNRISEMIESENLRLYYSDKAFERVGNYSAAKIVERWRNLFKGMLNE